VSKSNRERAQERIARIRAEEARRRKRRLWLIVSGAAAVVIAAAIGITLRTYTLGNFFDEWGQPLSTTQVGPATGHVVAIYNGQVYTGNPRNIPLTAHAQIQLQIGSPLVAPEQVTNWGGL
jgi:hypothetical protein